MQRKARADPLAVAAALGYDVVMPTDGHEAEALQALATLSGVETGYHDIAGELQRATPEALRALLVALGHDVARPGSVEAAIAKVKGSPDPVLEMITLAWDGRAELRLGLRPDAGRVRVDITLESGERLSDEREAGRLHRIELPGTPGLLGFVVSTTLPTGYHRVRVEADGRVHEGELWSAPTQAFQGDERPGWGVFAPTYALRSERGAGVGDLRDLGTLTSLVADRGGRLVSTLPLLPTFLDTPFDPSPYAPVSRMFWNELYLAIDELPELAEDPQAARRWSAAAELRAELRETTQVDYRRVMELKRRALEPLAATAFSHGPTRERIEAFLDERVGARDYAAFRATHEREGREFHRWSYAPGSSLPDRAYDRASFEYHAYVQWRAEQQLTQVAREAKERGVGLLLDLPLGSHPSGFDAWRYGDLLLPGCALGAPPDALFEGGQNWGFAPSHPGRSTRHGHAYFRESLAHLMRHASVVRLDHVMGLHRVFCVPDGMPATEGVYLRQPADQLYACVSIESHRYGVYVVGEDLGTVPEEVRQAMDRHRLGRLYVAQHSSPGDGGLHLPPNTVASLNTHDTPTFAGFWRGRDIVERVQLDLLDQADAEPEREERERQRRDRCERFGVSADGDNGRRDEALMLAEVRRMARTDARWLLITLEDLWLELSPQNVPGTGPEHANWRRKMARTLEEIAADDALGIRLATAGRRGAPSDYPAGHAAPGIDARFLTDEDLHFFNEGTHRRLYERMGAHLRSHDGRDGCFFSVWAPNAEAVSVVGDFNEWRGGSTPLYRRGQSGVWEAFVPGVHEGALYKFHITTPEGWELEKADPMARLAEVPPRTASRVTESRYDWGDAEWMAGRAEKNARHAPISVYELHLGSWRRDHDGQMLGYRELAPRLVEHVTRLGFSHVELMPVMEHPFYGSWGYQVTGYFAASSRQGSPDDLRYLIDQLHQAGIGVILDWVPGHFPEDSHGLHRFDGTALYEHADPRQGFHPDWKSAIFNYGRHEVQAFLISSAHYWLDTFHADGLRVDGVSSMLYLDYSRAEGEWVPNEHGGRENLDAIAFLRRLNEAAYGSFPDIMCFAEESTSWPMVSRPTFVGGLGFGSKWDMGWMHDTLRYFQYDPLHRKYHQELLTFRSLYAWHETFILPLSHDEVVHGKGSLLRKMPGDDWQKRANLRLLYSYLYATPGYKLLFMGSEFATDREWNHDAELDWGLAAQPERRGITALVGALNHLYRTEPALHQLDTSPEGFVWVETRNTELCVMAFERVAENGERLLCVMNATPVPRHGYRIGVQQPGLWVEVLNTDATEFGGSGVGNQGRVHTDTVGAQDRGLSLSLSLPPLGAVWFKSPPA